jgi:hypothetical protein
LTMAVARDGVGRRNLWAGVREDRAMSYIRFGLMILWSSKDGGAGAMKLNGVVLPLEAAGKGEPTVKQFATPGLTMTVRPLGDEAGWRANAELLFALEQGLSVGYRGFWACEK